MRLVKTLCTILLFPLIVGIAICEYQLWRTSKPPEDATVLDENTVPHGEIEYECVLTIQITFTWQIKVNVKH